MSSLVEKRNHRTVAAVLTLLMATPFLRVGRLSEQRLRMENSYGILRRIPNIVNFSANAGDPRKPVRYTSIKKAKPKTIIDIGKLLLQRANEVKTCKQSVIAEAALKAATQTAKPTALKQSAASSDSAGTTVPTPKGSASTSSSDVESRPSVSSSIENLKTTRLAANAIPTISVAMKPLIESRASDEYLYEVTTSEEKGIVSEHVHQDTAPNLTISNNVQPQEYSSSKLLPPFVTSSETSTGEIPESTSVYNNSTDEIVGSPAATPESGSEAVPIDVTYSEEVTLVSDATDIEVASMEPSVGVISIPATVTAKAVANSVDAPVAPEIFILERSNVGHSSAKGTLAPKDAEIINTPEGTTSTPEAVVVPDSPDVISSLEHLRVDILNGAAAKQKTDTPFPSSDVSPSRVTQQKQSTAQEVVATGAFTDVTSTTEQDVRGPLTRETLTESVHTASSSKILFEEGTIAHEITAEAMCAPGSVSKIAMTGPEPHHPEEMIPSSVAIEEAVIPDSVSRVIRSEGANQETIAGIPGDSTRQTEKSPEMVPVMTQSLDRVNAESVEEEFKPEDDKAYKSSEAQLDPVKRLFLDKIREYSTNSKAHDGLVDADPEYAKAFSEELTKLQRLYGNGDLTAFPEFNFPEPLLDETSPK